jgi:chromate transporter
VIINLAVWFGLHTLFSKVVTWRLGWFALDVPDPLVLPTLVLTAAAAVAIFRYQASIIGTLLAYAVAGLV